MSDPHHLVKLVTTTPIAARVLTARLGAEGIVSEVRGPSGPYPFGPAHVFVLETDLAEATELLDVVETSLTNDADEQRAARPERPPFALVGVIVVIVLMVAVSVARVVMFGP